MPISKKQLLEMKLRNIVRPMVKQILNEENTDTVLDTLIKSKNKTIYYGSPGYPIEGIVTNVTKNGNKYEIDMDLFIDGQRDEGHFTRLTKKSAVELITKRVTHYTEPNGGYTVLSFSPDFGEDDIEDEF